MFIVTLPPGTVTLTVIKYKLIGVMKDKNEIPKYHHAGYTKYAYARIHKPKDRKTNNHITEVNSFSQIHLINFKDNNETTIQHII